MTVMKPLQLQAYESLKQMILNGDLLPDHIYSETRTSKDLGISRTPMRDAIQKLEQEGYLDVIPSKGFRLHKMTEDDLIQTYQVRCALEGYCAVHFANISETPEAKRLFHTLESLLRDMDAIASTTEDVEEFEQYDSEFHKRLVYSLDNKTMSEMFDAYHYRMSLQTVASLRTKDRLKNTVAEHRAMLDSMKAGDVKGSYMATLKHIGQAKALIDITIE